MVRNAPIDSVHRSVHVLVKCLSRTFIGLKDEERDAFPLHCLSFQMEEVGLKHARELVILLQESEILF